MDNTAIGGEATIRDTFFNQTAVNTDMFDNELSLLAGYPEGRIIEVTWFSQTNAVTNLRSMNVERLTADSDITHYTFTQIRNFELRLANPLDFSYDKGTNISTMAGEALVMPGFEPLVNDLFLYKLRNDKVGIFVVNSIERTAIGNDTYHRITFDLTSYLTPDFLDKLTTQTTATTVFDKTKFLVGNHAVLTSDNYTLKKDFARIRSEIVTSYFDRYFVSDFNSFLRPDEVYDPYVVEYWNRKVGYNDYYRRPTQLLVSQQAFPRTIWAWLTGAPVSHSKLEEKSKVIRKGYANWDTNTNGLIDRKVLIMGPDIKFENNARMTRKFTSGPYGEYRYSTAAYNDVVARLRREHDYWYGEPSEEHPHTPEHDTTPDPLCKVCHMKYHDFFGHLNHSSRYGDSYGVSHEFYIGSHAMSTIEKLVYDAASAKEVNVSRIREVIDTHHEWDDDKAFYQYLLAIYLIDYGTNWLIHHS